MRFALRLALLGACIILAACAVDPKTIAITPQSPKALVVVQLEPSPIGASLLLASYDVERGIITATPFGGATSIGIPQSNARTYAISVVDPGKYVFAYVAQQIYWETCFHEHTSAFDVKPGEVVYLGVFDARPHLLQLNALVLRSGMTSTRDPVPFFDGILPPRIAEPKETDLPAVGAYLAATSPLVTSQARIATYTPARFGTGRDAFGIQKLCTGYYSEEVNKKASK